MNVLSLFDGISCGQTALKRINMKVNNYFASEIDKNAIKVTQYHYPNTIDLGNIESIRGKNLPRIDLLMGGSPCQGFSFAGKRLNFNDSRSKLFFEFIRLLKETHPEYFLLENVRMKKKYEKIISNYIGLEPILINSNKFSKQNRVRLYWTNIPIKNLENINNNQKFNNYLYRLGHGYIKDEIKFFEFYPTLVAQSPATKYRIVIDIKKAKKASISELRKNSLITRSATPEECEEFQTLPISYTKILPKTKRYQVIGNGWTIDVIAYILSEIL